MSTNDLDFVSVVYTVIVMTVMLIMVYGEW